MKLSTRSRYGTRLLLDMAQNYGNGPLQLTSIANRQGISVKYLEQIIIPLKKAHYVKSVRGPKGGHVLARPPEEITGGEMGALREAGAAVGECWERPEGCAGSKTGFPRHIWREAAGAMFAKLNA